MKLDRLFLWGCITHLLLFCQMVSAGEQQSANAGFRRIAQTVDGWEIEYIPRSREYTTVVIDGKKYLRFVDPTVVDGKEDGAGSPQLPTDAISLGIPFGSSIKADLVNAQYETENDQSVAPPPSYEITTEQEAVEIFSKNARAYSLNGFLPSPIVSVEPPFTLRLQKVSTIRIRPYQYDPSTRILRRLTKATLRVQLIGGQPTSKEAPVKSQASNDPMFEETYKTLLWNYEQAKEWRVHPARSGFSLADPTHDWFETGKNYYKALVAGDGWYAITRNEILAAGGNLSAIDLSTLKVFVKGNQIPIVIRADTTIEFYAYRNYGDSTFNDFYTDTSAYWLTWEGTAGIRFAAASVSGTPASTITSASHTIHFEQELAYYTGTTQAEQIDVNTVPGEGWYWRAFNVNTQIDFSFSLDSLEASVSNATIHARLWGTGYNSPPTTPALHKTRFWINDSLVGDADFGQRAAGLLSATIPASWLKVGTNTLRVKAIDTGTSGNSFYLDWFEFTYGRKLRATNNQLLFVSPNSSGGNPNQFVLRGFSNAQIEVFDLSTKRAISGATVSGDSTSGFSIAFQDTFSSQRTYVAIDAGSQLHVSSLKQKAFSDIRVNPQGSDYIIICHKNFLSQANQLASHRQSVNGIRAKVIDVEDIYDEFNFGVTNGTKIKTFLLYAYTNWAAPSISNVLFFGDASWDYHRYFSNTVKTDYVPSYGVPTTDNWFGCFDSTLAFIPSLYIGRIPAENMSQAQSAVNKIIGYDNYSLSEWNKSFLFITGGISLSEQTGFNYLAESAIASYVIPPPVGGIALRVYKASARYVDGDRRQEIQDLLRGGIVFLSFTGHSGGRVWGVDPGPVSEFENTNGRLPFVASVSCNVGGFANPASSVFSEDLLLSDNRGAIAAWASSSLGYATYGAALTNYFLANATVDSVREFGKLTTNARYRLWFETGSGYITVAMVNLNPLIGDPMSKMAVPLKPELAITPADIIVNKPLPTPTDSALTVRMNIHNYGLVPTDSVGISLTDSYNGNTTTLLNNHRMQKTFTRDSMFIPWPVTTQVGLHTLTATLDPVNSIDEVNELNNITTADQYVYTNNVFVVRPLNNMVVVPGTQHLVVTSPVGYDSASFLYFFELDTVETFNSSALVTSGGVSPSDVKGEWVTPSLPSGKIYFWRARTKHGALTGNWVISSFSTSNDLPLVTSAALPLVRLRENTKSQFARDALSKVTPTDSGVTISPLPPISIYCRSLGPYYDQYREYYGIITVNGISGIGYWYNTGGSFVAARVNEFTGTMECRNFPLYAAYDVPDAGPWQADSMANFINSTPAGSYIAVTTIFNGQTNVNEPLRRAMDSLGATQFRSILNGQTYVFIGRKGNGAPGMTPLELLHTNDSAVVSLTVPSYYGYGSGSITSAGIPIAQSWDSFHWRHSGDLSKTNPRMALLGVRAVGGIDTLRIIAKDSIDVNLASLNSQTQGPRYASLKLSGLLSTSDANVTPLLTDWWLDFSPPADLAVSARTLGVNQTDGSNSYNLPITIHNIGYTKSDSARVVVYALDKYNATRQIATAVLDSVDIGSSRSTTVNFSTVGLPRKTRLQVVVGSAKKGRDLIAENNTAYYMIYVNNIAVADRLHVYANGTEVMDGDYISPSPTLLVRATRPEEQSPQVEQSELFVDKKPAVSVALMPLMKRGGISASSEQTFTPMLANGPHELKFRLSRMNVLGEIDSMERIVNVNVLNESRLLQVYNYPNPFSNETEFTFILTGAQVAEEVSIKIFTVAGRKIREIVVPPSSLQLGFNRIHWNGRDEDGDEIANGYYFYQVRLKADNTIVSPIQKLAKIR